MIAGDLRAYLFLRTMFMGVDVLIHVYLIKHFDLIYVSIASNSEPLAAMILSYLYFGERFKCIDQILFSITFAGVLIISISKDN